MIHSDGHGTFCKFSVKGLPESRGVYVFQVEGQTVYIGKAVNLAKRFSIGYGTIAPRLLRVRTANQLPRQSPCARSRLGESKRENLRPRLQRSGSI